VAIKETVMDLQNATQFWTWFKAHNAKYLFLDEMPEDRKNEAMKELQDELHKYCDSIYYLIGDDHNDNKELIITAEGNIRYFDHVEFLIDNALPMPRWNFLKFKPAIGVGYKAVIQNREFDPRQTRCAMLESEDPSKGIGLRLYYNDFDLKAKRSFAYGTYVMLDMILGEKSATLDIEKLEIVKTPENIEDLDYFFLDQIKAHIALNKLGK